MDAMIATAAEPATSSQPARTTPAVPSATSPSVEDEARAPAQVARAVEGGAVISAAMTRLAARTADAEWWPATDRRAVLSAMDREIDGLGAARAAVLVAERASGAWEVDGDRSFEARRGRTSNVGQRTATVQVRAAEVDPARLEHDHRAQRAARYLNLTETDKGTYIKDSWTPTPATRSR